MTAAVLPVESSVLYVAVVAAVAGSARDSSLVPVVSSSRAQVHQTLKLFGILGVQELPVLEAVEVLLNAVQMSFFSSRCFSRRCFEAEGVGCDWA